MLYDDGFAANFIFTKQNKITPNIFVSDVI